MKLKKILSVLLCICMVASFIPFAVNKAEAATTHKDIDGKEWATSVFASKHSGIDKPEGKSRFVILHGEFVSYGSELKDGKYPIVSPGVVTDKRFYKTDNEGNRMVVMNIPTEQIDSMWMIEYYDTTSNADRYKICLSDGETYLKDNTGSLPTSGGDLTVATGKASGTPWDLRFVKFDDDGDPIYSFGHDISSADPHFYVNEGSGENPRHYLDLSRDYTSYFEVYIEMPWLTTTFYNSNGYQYKKDERQIGSFKAPACPEERTGYTFMGWTDTKGSAKVVYFPGDEIKPTSSKNYYPVYAANTYTVRFYSNSDLVGDYFEQSFTYDVEQALTMNTFTSPTGTFKQWISVADKTKAYQNGETVKNLSATNGGRVDLYAEWNEFYYTVAFSANYGTGEIAPVRVRYSENFALPTGDTLARDGYMFLGWNTKADGSGDGYSAGHTVSKLCTEMDGKITLFAVWAPQHTHKAGVWQTVKTATCTAEGLKVKKCGTCGVVMEEQAVATVAHTPGLWQITKDCTCTESGLKQQACAVCGALLGEPVEIAPHEHQLGGEVTHIEATCTKAGEKVKTCTVCDVVIETVAILKLGHTPGAFITDKAATCTAAGHKTQKCETCGVTLAEEEIPAKGHTKGEYYVIVEKPTCNDEGVKVYYCEICNAPVATEAVSAKGHKPGAFKTVLEPTCTVDGRKEQKCETCGVVLAEEAIPATGHTCEAWVTTLEPTCVDAGEKVCKCDTCGMIYKTERIEPLGHDPGPAATCVDDQLCLVCGEVLEKADGRSHTWSEWATSKEAGFFTERQERRFCTACNKEEFRYVSGTAGCHKYFPHGDDCDNCGACDTLHNVNAFFRNVGKVLTFIFFGNVGINVIFPWLHEHFHHWFNPNK